jgi:hypothetical protein
VTIESARAATCRSASGAQSSSAYSSEESFVFGAQEKIRIARWSTSAGTYGNLTMFEYSGLGAVLARERRMTSSINWETEEFRVDGLRNVRRNRAVSSGSGATMATNTWHSARGALNGRKAEPRPLSPQESDSLAHRFDADGHLVTASMRSG